MLTSLFLLFAEATDNKPAPEPPITQTLRSNFPGARPFAPDNPLPISLAPKP